MNKHFFLFAFILVANTSNSQELTKNDYARAVSFLFQNLNNKKTFSLNITPIWAGDSSGFAFLSQNKEGRMFNKVDLKKMQIEPLFDKERLAKLLSDTLKTQIKANEFSFFNGQYIDKNKVSFTAGNKNFTLDLTTYKLTNADTEPGNEMEEQSLCHINSNRGNKTTKCCRI
jgi:hypothetical protein